MASTGGQQLKNADDPLRVSAFISALLELVLSVLLLLGAAIAFATSLLVKFYGLEPPCAYIGCSHTLMPSSRMRRRYSVHGLHSSKEDCANELCPDCGSSWGYTKLHGEEFLSSNDDTDGCVLSETDVSSSRDLTALTSDLDNCSHHHVDESYDHKSVDCSCSACSSPIYKKSSRSKYDKPGASIFCVNGTAEEECIPLFSTRSVSACSSHSDDEDQCEISSASTGNNTTPSSPKCLQKGTQADHDASMHSFEGVSGNSEDEHDYMLLEWEDEEICEALFFYGSEVNSRDSKDEHCYMLLEDEDKDVSDAPSRGYFLSAESEQPLLQFVADDELEEAKVSAKFVGTVSAAFECANKVANVVVVLDSLGQSDVEQLSGGSARCKLTEDSRDSRELTEESRELTEDSRKLTEDSRELTEDSRENTCTTACGLSSRPNEVQTTGGLRRVFLMTESVVEDEILDVWGKGHMKEGLTAFQMNTDFIQGSANIHSGNSDEPNCSPSDVCCRNAALVQDFQLLQGQTYMDEPTPVPARTCFAGNEVSTATDVQGVHEDVLSKKGVEEGRSIFDDYVHATEGLCDGQTMSKAPFELVLSMKSVEEGCSILNDHVHATEGRCDGQTISKASFESVIREAMYQYLVSFGGCHMEEKGARSVSSSENIEEYLDVVKGTRLEEESIEEPYLMASSQNDDLTPTEVVLKDSSAGGVDSNAPFTETREKDQSFHVMDAERGTEQRDSCLEQVVLPLPATKANQIKEETASEEDQEEGLDSLREALRVERTILAAVEMELENERNAAAIATSEAMAMISRLQEEKSAMQMEVKQLQRMSEEKADYDEKAMELLKEILFKREKEKHALEKEVEMYRERLLTEKVDMAKRSSAGNEGMDVLIRSLAPVLLLRGTDEDYDAFSPEGRIDRHKGLPSLQEFYDPGITSAPRKEDQGDFVDPFTGGPNVLHDTHQELRGTSRSIFSTHEEETQFILERLWVLEEELQELRGQDGLGEQKHSQKSSEVQHLDGSPIKRRSDRCCADSCSADGERGGERDENGAGMFLPVHDVYEVQLAPNHRRQEVGGSDTLKCSQISQEAFEASPREEYMATSTTQSHRPEVLSHARRLSPPVEARCDSAFIRKQDIVCADDSHTQHLQETERRLVTTDAMQQLAVRLQVLETDRELLREVLESFKHRDAELNLLQEIAQHLRELRMAGFGRASSGGEEQGPFSPTFGKSCAGALKKRRYCGGPGQSQILLLQQNSI